MILETYSKIMGREGNHICRVSYDTPLINENQNFINDFYQLMYENDKNWFEIESQLRISEYMKIEEGHQTILTEGVSEFFKKIIEAVKNFFRKLKEIIVGIFNNVKDKSKKIKNTKSLENVKKEHKDAKFNVSAKLVHIFEKNKEKLLSPIEDVDIEDFILVGPKASVLNKHDPKTKEGAQVYREYFSSENGYKKELFDMNRKIITEIEKVFVGLNKYTSSLKSKQFESLKGYINDFNGVFKEYLKDLSEQKTEISIAEATKIIDESGEYIKYLGGSSKKIDNLGKMLTEELKLYERNLQALNIDESLCKLILANVNYAISVYFLLLNGYTSTLLQSYLIPIHQIENQLEKFW